MVDLAKYIRIYDPSPDDDMVTKREAAIKDAVTQLRKNNVITYLVSLGASAASAFQGVAPDPIGATVAAAIKKQASAFVREEREHETAVLSAVAAMAYLEGAEASNHIIAKDIVGATIWSALSFQSPIDDPKFEQLRQDLLEAAASRSLARAETGRKRTPPVDVPAAADGDLAQIGKSLGAAVSAVSALKTNATLDREEIDVLWWALGGRSPITGKGYDGLAPVQRGMLRGFELGILLRRLPSTALRSLALSGIPQTEAIAFPAVIEALGEIREQLAARIPAGTIVAENAVAFPLLSAIANPDALYVGPTKTGDEWCARAILETGLASLCANPQPSL